MAQEKAIQLNTRVKVVTLVNLLGFSLIALAMIWAKEAVAIQALQSIGLLLTTVNGTFMGTKIAEHGTKFLKRVDK